MRICILRLSALGDIVMCLPLLRTLQKSFPHAKITWMIGKPFYPLLDKIEGVEFIPISKIKSFKDWLAIKFLLKQREFDVLLACQASFSAHLIYPLIKAKRKIGYDKFRSKDFHALFIDERIPFKKEHTLEGFLSFAKALSANSISFDSQIPLAGEEEKWAEQFEAPYFVINPCSSKKAKDWNYENYIPIIEFVKKKYKLNPILIGGPADQIVCSEIQRQTGAINLSGMTSLGQLTALLKNAKFLLSPDTGPAHIASAIGTPTIGLFAPTSSHITGPYFSKSAVIDKHDEALKLYGSANEKKLGWNVRIYHKEAMNLIGVHDVKEKIHLICP